jgi:nitrogen regulatory protein P-II 1
MKLLSIIIHRSAQQDLADQLRGMAEVSGFTFSRAEGHGVQVEHDVLLSAHDKVVGYTPRVRVEIMLEDAQVAVVLAALSSASSYLKGQGVYWVTTVEQHGHL